MSTCTDRCVNPLQTLKSVIRLKCTRSLCTLPPVALLNLSSLFSINSNVTHLATPRNHDKIGSCAISALCALFARVRPCRFALGVVRYSGRRLVAVWSMPLLVLNYWSRTPNLEYSVTLFFSFVYQFFYLCTLYVYRFFVLFLDWNFCELFSRVSIIANFIWILNKLESIIALCNLPFHDIFIDCEADVTTPVVILHFLYCSSDSLRVSSICFFFYILVLSHLNLAFLTKHNENRLSFIDFPSVVIESNLLHFSIARSWVLPYHVA